MSLSVKIPRGFKSIKMHPWVLQVTLHLPSTGISEVTSYSGTSEENTDNVDREPLQRAQITTSESAAFQLQRMYFTTTSITRTERLHTNLRDAGDSALPNFKAFAGLIKETKDNTKHALENLLPVSVKPSLWNGSFKLEDCTVFY